jgi:glyoxylase-like metal-dependent hydrolase (beta-lactamase superfamily II)
MTRRISLRCIVLACSVALVALANLALPAEAVSGLRLYAADCGRLDFKMLDSFSDTDEYDGRSGSLIVPCFIIRHPKGTLIWDFGLGDSLVANKAGIDNGPVHLSATVTLVDQLQALGLTPADVNFVAFSHLHFDHTGNANLFPGSTWIINKRELAYALSEPRPFGVALDTFSAYSKAKTVMIDGDYDVFGDGSVRILRTPGHTPGHQILELNLKKAGTLILSGDLYHLRESVATHRLPTINVDRADTLASMDRVDKLLITTHGRLIVEHDYGDFKSLPKLPAFLD